MTSTRVKRTGRSVFRRVGAVVLSASLLFLALPERASAEPYLAVQKGLHCSACHSHTAGGGRRIAYGNVFAQNEMPAETVGGGEQGIWTGQVMKFLAVGGNFRSRYESIDIPGNEELSEFDVTRGTVYLEATLIPNRLSVYVDQQLAPNGSLNREAYAKVRDRSGKWHLAGGQFYLPYGLRLQDDSAFIRRTTGINFETPDRGLQLGYENGSWSTIVSATNGSGGGAEIDDGKQFSAVTTWVRPGWRVGASFNDNNADAGDRQMFNVFAGLRTGPVAWLAEVDRIRDDLDGGATRDAIAGLVEGNWLLRKGHNLKIGYEYFDPDDDLDEDHQVRWSAIWEYTPIQFLQGRVGVRLYDGVPESDFDNRDEYFLELHGFF
ncbi:MAG: hypothetical protein AAFX56_20370 [Pseudomonadota bacterium]